MLDAVFTYEGSTIGVHHCNPLELTCGKHIYNLVMVISPHQVCTEWLLLPLLWVGGSLLLNQLSSSHSDYLFDGAYSLGGLAESHLIPLPSLHGREGSSFPSLVPSDDMVDSESAVDIKPGDSGVVIGYQFEFTHTWSAEWFVAHSYIYPVFTGKVSSLTNFPLEPGCEDYSFLDQAVADFEQGFDSILTNSIETLGLDTSLDEPDAITSSVSCRFLCLVSTISDNSKWQLALSIRSHELWCQARALLVPVSLATNMSASTLTHYFSNHPATFRFQSFTWPDNITLTSANRKADQSLSEFQTDMGAAAYATLDMEQVTSHLRVALVDTLSSLPNLKEALYLCLMCVNCFSRLMTFWTILCPNVLGTQLIY